MPAAAALLLCAIVGITDGDTLTARCETQMIKVRLAEIDAPEKGQPYADRSKQHLSSLCYDQQAEIHPKTKTVTTGLWLASTALASMPMRQWCETG